MDDQNKQTPGEPTLDVADVIEIRDPEIDVEAVMAQLRARIAERRAAGTYRDDLNAVAEQVRAEVLAAEATPLPPSGAGLDATLAELNQRWSIRERPFVSNAPVVGPLIVAFRNAWNWMSTKWYVRGILEQIVTFNSLVVRGFQDVATEQHQVRAQAQQVAQVAEAQGHEVVALEQRVRELEARLDQVQRETDALREELGRLRSPTAPPRPE